MAAGSGDRPPADLDEFVIAARRFLEAHAERRAETTLAWGSGDDSVVIPLVSGGQSDPALLVAASQDWQRRCFDAGFGWLGGPVELGGRGLPPRYEQAYQEEAARYALPDDAFVRTGTKVLGPSLLEFGSHALKSEHLPRIHRGDELVCQLFSEPGAGSDLANVATRAVPAGDPANGWTLNGQKVWSSGAQFADLGVCLARTSSTGRKHQGLTMFVVAMSAPGVTVRPIRQMTGGAEFCEVFLDDVRVPDSNRLSTVDNGWAVTMHALAAERATIGQDALPDPALVDRLVDLARHLGRSGDPLVRQALADVHIRLTVARLMAERLSAPAAGSPGDPAATAAGAQMALTKIAVTEVFRRIAQVSAGLLGPRLCADDSTWGTFAWNAIVLGAPALAIGGGTDEVLRNGVGERALGLPREAR